MRDQIDLQVMYFVANEIIRNAFGKILATGAAIWQGHAC